MIVGTRFAGDNDEVLKSYQHDNYGKLLGVLFRAFKNEYLHSQSILGIETDFGKRLRATDSFDHRLLQDMHDLIATTFRFDNPDSRQLSLLVPEDNAPLTALSNDLKNRWHEYVWNISEQLAKNDNYCTPVLEAVLNDDFEKAHSLVEAMSKSYQFSLSVEE